MWVELSEVAEIRVLQQSRQTALTLALATIVIAIVSIISGTISQTGHFPLVHGIFGVALSLL